jgi:hypothetical protein
MRKYFFPNIFMTILACVSTTVAWTVSLTAIENSRREVAGALLHTTINAKPDRTSREGAGRIQPGTPVKLSASIKNSGDVPSAAGKVFLRFAFPKPLDKESSSVVFETDPETLPSIQPGETITINFKKSHQWPSLFDYIRNDWAMREYEAIVEINRKEYLTGTRAISFSAYYYEGQEEHKPVRVSSANLISNKKMR